MAALSHSVDEALAWASAIIPTLQQILDHPFDDHPNVRYMQPAGGLRNAHVIGLLRLLRSGKPNSPGPWQKHFSNRRVTYRGAALHIWLYHLLQGGGAKLRVPDTCKSDMWNQARLGEQEKEERSFTAKRQEYESKVRTKSGATKQTAQEQLQALLAGVWLPYDWGWLHATRPTTPAVSAAPAPPTPPDSSTDQALTASDLRWLVARGAATTASPLHAIAGQSDVLRYVCDLACIGGLARWTPTPQLPRLRMVEQLLCLEHRRSWLLGQQLDERDLLVDELQTAAVRSERREHSAFDQATAAIERAHRIRAEDSERFNEFVAETEKYVARLHREYGREMKVAGTEWQLKVNRSENFGATAVQAAKAKLRDELAAVVAQRDAVVAEHKKEAEARAEAEAQLQAERAASARLRELRTGSEVERRRALEEECKRLRQRRSGNQRRISDYNLGERRVQVAQQVQTPCCAC